MNDLKIVGETINAKETMSSMQIAEITGKQHQHVLRDIDSLLNQGLDASNFGLTSYLDNCNRNQRMYNLTKKGCLILASGYDALLREKIINRWEELELKERQRLEAEQHSKFPIPQTLSEALYLDKNKIKPIILKEVEPLISKGSGQKRKRVLCKCGYCGKEFIAQKYSITSGKTKSCGCLQVYTIKKKFTIHGDSFSRLNNIFRAMKRRCYNKACKDYKKKE